MGWWKQRDLLEKKYGKPNRRAELWDKKEKFYIPEPAQFPCPDDSHPLFTINATKDRMGVCYYCSKVFIVGEDPNET